MASVAALMAGFAAMDARRAFDDATSVETVAAAAQPPVATSASGPVEVRVVFVRPDGTEVAPSELAGLAGCPASVPGCEREAPATVHEAPVTVSEAPATVSEAPAPVARTRASR
ncbi:MAG: hypothetical protein OEY23_14590 [Acidimicrobiia bacterium]|nr:hypothetical protein [Acidimicrobiia bacterium]